MPDGAGGVGRDSYQPRRGTGGKLMMTIAGAMPPPMAVNTEKFLKSHLQEEFTPEIVLRFENGLKFLMVVT